MKKAKTNFLLLFFPICLFSCGKSADYYKNEGDSNFQSNDFHGAVSDFTKAIELTPKDAEAYEKRGYAKMYLGDQQGAIIDFTKAIELYPQYPSAYLRRGAAKINLNDKNGACLDWSKAGELGYKEAYKMIQKHCQ
jgi:tetratricopeptide (TPR) repeat protein